MRSEGVAFAIAMLAVAALLAANKIERAQVQPKPTPAVASEPVELDSLFVSSDQPAVVIVADLASEYGSKWLASDADKLRANGWNVRSLDLQGCEDVRFYVLARGKWLAHNGHMSLSGLRAMVGQ